MSETRCNHCGETYDDALAACPYCNTPAPRQRDREAAGTQRRFIRFFLVLVVVCAILMLWWPREV